MGEKADLRPGLAEGFASYERPPSRNLRDGMTVIWSLDGNLRYWEGVNSTNRTPAMMHSTPWNKGVAVGQKSPLQPHQVWRIRGRLETRGKVRDLALFSFALDSMLRSSDILRLRVGDVCGSHLKPKTRLTVVSVGYRWQNTESSLISTRATSCRTG